MSMTPQKPPRILVRVAWFAGVGALFATAGTFFPLGKRVPVYKDEAVLAYSGGKPEAVITQPSSALSKDTYRISNLSVFSNVVLQVKENYVEPSRISPRDMLLAALRRIEREIAEVLVEEIGQHKIRISVPGHQKEWTVADVGSLWEMNLRLRDVFQFLEETLPPQKDIRTVEYAAINGALSTLDPHSVLLRPEDFAEMKTSTNGEFGGLGIVISIRDGKLTIVSSMAGTPAARAGLKAADVIVRIGDVSTVSMNIDEAVQKLRGPEGSKATIWVQRANWPEPRKFVLTREKIRIDSCESHRLAEDVGYLKIKNFQKTTAQDLDEHIAELTANGQTPLKGLILDLRNNPGGLLEQAIRVADRFLNAGDIVTTVGYGNRLRDPKRAQAHPSDLAYPVVVLVNNQSASASEIVAGALRNLDRGVILGERTFGKGSVQVLYDFPDNSALKLTIAQYLTPGGVSIQNVGVSPDIEIRRAVINKDTTHLFYDSDAHREASLDKHLDRRSDRATIEDGELAPKFLLTYVDEPEPKNARTPNPAEPSANGATTEQATEDADTPNDQPYKEDFVTKVARQILTVTKEARRSDMLKAAAPLVEEMARREDARIASAILGLGLDWSVVDGTTASSHALRVEMRMESQPSAGDMNPSIAEALTGDDLKLVVSVTNTETRPIARVYGAFETENPALRGREILFGTIHPGQTVTRTLTQKIPREIASRADVVALRLRSDRVVLDATAKIALVTSHVHRPKFAYSYAVDDTERGDGDGVLERGEGVDFVVFATNIGKGAADKVWVRLRSGAAEDLFLETGRVEIGSLASNETKVARLRFKVRPNQTPGRANLPVELAIGDQTTQEWLSDEIALVAETPVPTRLLDASGVVVVHDDSPVFAAAQPGAATLGIVKKGIRLLRTKKLNDRYKVQLKNQVFGWISAKSTRSSTVRLKKQYEPTVDFHPARTLPWIELDGIAGGRVVNSGATTISGSIMGAGLKDAYIFVNDKKLAYFGGGATREPDRVGQPPIRFSQTIELKDGSNRVVIVARGDGPLMATHELFIARASPTGPAVAEAP